MRQWVDLYICRACISIANVLHMLKLYSVERFFIDSGLDIANKYFTIEEIIEMDRKRQR